MYSVAHVLEAYRCMLPFEPAVQRIPMVLMVTDFWWQMTISVCLCVQDGVKISLNEAITVKREEHNLQSKKISSYIQYCAKDLSQPSLLYNFLGK